MIDGMKQIVFLTTQQWRLEGRSHLPHIQTLEEPPMLD
jgi:hypothetical protein